MALIRSKLHLAFPKSFIKPFSLPFSTVFESAKNPNFSEDDEETHEIDANVSSPRENPAVEVLYSLIKDHYKNNQHLYQNPNYNFTFFSLIHSFNEITPGECVSPSILVSVIEKCLSVTHDIPFPQALAFFNWAVREDNNVENFKQGFVEMVDLAGKVKEFDVAWGLIDEMKRRKIEIPSEIFVRLIKRYVKAGMVSEAIHAFNRMEEYGVRPDNAAITAVIGGLCRHGQITRAHDVFAEMIEKGCQPNAATFNNLMRVHVKAGKTEKVLQVHNQMKKLGCQPDVDMYSFLIDCHCRDGSRNDAMKLIDEMVNKGIVPSVHSFNLIFNCIAKARDVNAAQKLFAKMGELKCQPNTETYNVLMRIFVESKSTDMVLKLKKEMDEETHEIDPNISSNISAQEKPVVEGLHSLIKDHYKENPDLYQNPNYNFTISSLAHSFNEITPGECVSPSIVVSVIKKCRSVTHDIPFAQALAFFNWAGAQCDNVETFKQGFVEMVDLAGKVKEFDVAWGLIDEMKCRKIEIPSEIFVRLIKRYVRAGMLSEAIHAFNRMEEYGCSLDSSAITAVIVILVKKKKAVEAQSFFDGLKDRFEPDVVVYTNLINCWCKVGNISEAERVFGEMKSKGIFPNVYTYSIIIDGLCRHGKITRAHDVFFEMIEKGLQPNAETFNNLMRVHVKAGKTEKVLQVHNQMKKLGCQPDVDTYSFLIDCHCRDGSRNDAMKLIDQMVNKGIVPSVHSFNLIFNCIAKARDVNAAQKLFAKMEELKCQPNTVTYNVLMRIFVESKSTDMVFKLKKEMDELELNEKTYRILISMFCAKGHWSNACKYFREMVEEKNLTPSTHVYEMVLRQLRIADQIKRGLADRPNCGEVSISS